MGISVNVETESKSTRWNAKAIRNLVVDLLFLLLLIGMAVCVICDMAIAGRFTWSPIPISAIVYAGLVLFPVLKMEKNGIYGTMLAISIVTIPFLMILDGYLNTEISMLPIGIPVTIIAVIVMWSIAGLFALLKTRKRIASAISLLLLIPLDLGINIVLFKVLQTPVVGLGDLVGFAIILIAAVCLLVSDATSQRL